MSKDLCAIRVPSNAFNLIQRATNTNNKSQQQPSKPIEESKEQETTFADVLNPTSRSASSSSTESTAAWSRRVLGYGTAIVKPAAKKDADKESDEKSAASSKKSVVSHGPRVVKSKVKPKSKATPVAPPSMDQVDIPAGASDEARAALQLFFAGMVRGVTPSSVHEMTARSFSLNAELTMQILMHARDARDGKGEKAVVLEALCWLRAHKPKTYMANLIEFLRLGYFKDLLTIATMVQDRRLPLLGESDIAPLEVELLAEFLRSDRDALQAFRTKQEAKFGASTATAADEPMEKPKEESKEEQPKKETVPKEKRSIASASVVPAPTSEDFELTVAPSVTPAASSSSSSSSSSKKEFTMDLCFVIDSTGSMGAWLETAKTSVRNLVSQMQQECARSGIEQTKVRLALLAYQDYFDNNRYDHQDFTTDIDEFLSVLNTLSPRGGADEPEDMIGGIEEALKYKWNEKADVRMMILIADAPCHGDQFSSADSSESKAHLLKHPEDPEATIKSLQTKNIHFVMTRITRSTDIMIEKFQGWYDNRKERKCMNILQLGQQVKRFLPMLVEELTMTALGRKPEVETEESKKKEEQEETEEELEIITPEEALAAQAEQESDSVASSSKKPARVKKAPTAQLSLAGKWTPTERSHFDHAPYKFASKLGKLLYPEVKTPAKSYRQLCSSLRSELHVVERLMCTQQWSAIDFATVPARCHRLLKKAFVKWQPERYAVFLQRVKKGEVSIKTAGIQPHELTQQYRKMRLPVKEDETTEAQWKQMVEKLKKDIASENAKQQVKLAAALSSSSSSTPSTAVKPLNALVMIDTSGSMTWNMQLDASGRNPVAANLDNKMEGVAPIDAAIALGLIVSQLTTGPFKDRVLTFSESPRWLQLPNSDSASLCERVDALYSNAESGGSTNLTSSLQMILDVAIGSSCQQSDLPNILFVLSDMDLSSTMSDKASLKKLQSQYESAGFQMPTVVLWNLAARAAGKAETVSSLTGDATSESRLMMLSGYSASLLKMACRQDLLGADPMTMLVETVAAYKNVHIHEEER